MIDRSADSTANPRDDALAREAATRGGEAEDDFGGGFGGAPGFIPGYTNAEDPDGEVAFYQELVAEYGKWHVEYANRAFYLRNWKRTHGCYPYPLDYMMLKAIAAVREEVQLRQAYDNWKISQKQRAQEMQFQSMSRANLRAQMLGGGGGSNRF